MLRMRSRDDHENSDQRIYAALRRGNAMPLVERLRSPNGLSRSLRTLLANMLEDKNGLVSLRLEVDAEVADQLVFIKKLVEAGIVYDMFKEEGPGASEAAVEEARRRFSISRATVYGWRAWYRKTMLRAFEEDASGDASV